MCIDNSLFQARIEIYFITCYNYCNYNINLLHFMNNMKNLTSETKHCSTFSATIKHTIRSVISYIKLHSIVMSHSENKFGNIQK